MTYEISTLEELSPEDVIKLAIPGLRACETQAQRVQFARSLTQIIKWQIEAAIELGDLESEFEYVQAKHQVADTFHAHLFPKH